MKKKIFILTFFLLLCKSYAQEYFPTNIDIKSELKTHVLIENATIIVSPGEIIKNGSLLVKDGKIVEVGSDFLIPSNTVKYDMSGHYIYPSFVDVSSSFGTKNPSNSPRSRSTEYKASRQGYYWNDHIMSDYNTITDFSYDTKKSKELREFGFGIVNSHRKDGVHRGTGALVALDDKSNNSFRILKPISTENLSFDRSSQFSQAYPSSIMGAMALIRQFYHDLKWYKDGGSKSTDMAIEAAIKNYSLPKIFSTNDKLNVIRALKISDELGFKTIVEGSGYEFENIEDLKNYDNTIVVPINYPKAFDLTDLHIVEKLTLNQLKRWNQAPSNLVQLSKNNINFAISPKDVKNSSEFFNNIRKSISYGLSREKALAALTINPAKAINMEDKIGVIKNGAYANFLVTSGPIFEKETIIFENWVLGNKHTVKNVPKNSIDGDYVFSDNGSKYELGVKNSQGKINVSLKKDSIKLTVKSTVKNGWLNMSIVDKKNELYGFISSNINNNSLSSISFTDFKGDKKNIFLNKSAENKDSKKESKKYNQYDLVPVSYPNKAYGFKSKPKKQNILFKNATVWTSESDGILENTDVLVIDGKIKSVGKNLNFSDVKIIDATNKHITAGIIDEHSHIAASSINEGGQNSSAEVSIKDVVDHEDINIYRNLSGGVTTIQILHGSANPIGGQSAIIKLKWGEKNDEMIFKDAPKFIKFALGENVKQSNWGSYNRYPQSRMGVEQVFVDHFQRASEYDKEWKRYNNLPKREKNKTIAPRFDIEMEAIAEILNNERHISCHSYVQSEINMLMKVAEKFDFTVATFTHILEGYKVASLMKRHGVGGAAFSDWWGYKFEVNDAIPYNGPIMTKAGVLVAYNSDDAEMSRRLNQEAAKAVKYGNLSEEEAWKYVTLNPAKLLKIDDKVGSIKVGKHADLVLWDNNPLSVYANAEKTMIEGIFYYEKDNIESMLKSIQEEKNLILSMMIEAKKRGEETVEPVIEEKRIYECETVETIL